MRPRYFDEVLLRDGRIAQVQYTDEDGIHIVIDNSFSLIQAGDVERVVRYAEWDGSVFTMIPVDEKGREVRSTTTRSV